MSLEFAFNLKGPNGLDSQKGRVLVEGALRSGISRVLLNHFGPALSKTLEIGAGLGDLKDYIPDLYRKDYISSDVSPAVLSEPATPGGTALIRLAASAYALPFADPVFDAVVAMNVLSILDNPQKALAEANRVLRSGGLLAHFQVNYPRCEGITAEYPDHLVIPSAKTLPGGMSVWGDTFLVERLGIQIALAELSRAERLRFDMEVHDLEIGLGSKSDNFFRYMSSNPLRLPSMITALDNLGIPYQKVPNLYDYHNQRIPQLAASAGFRVIYDQDEVASVQRTKTCWQREFESDEISRNNYTLIKGRRRFSLDEQLYNQNPDLVNEIVNIRALVLQKI